MKLFYSPGSCSLAPHLILNESGLAYEAVAVDLRKKTYAGSDFRQINPKGYVPTLEISNGQVLTECSVILQYLADQKPEAKLIPTPGSFDRYRCLEWVNFVATEIHKGFAPLWNPKTPDAYKEMVRENLSNRLEFVANQLADHEYLMGKQYSIADAYLFTTLSWSSILKFDLSPWAPIIKFVDRVKARPATLTTMKKEGLLK